MPGGGADGTEQNAGGDGIGPAALSFLRDTQSGRSAGVAFKKRVVAPGAGCWDMVGRETGAQGLEAPSLAPSGFQSQIGDSVCGRSAQPVVKLGLIGIAPMAAVAACEPLRGVFLDLLRFHARSIH